jgi:hypothetical protein
MCCPSTIVPRLRQAGRPRRAAPTSSRRPTTAGRRRPRCRVNLKCFTALVTYSRSRWIPAAASALSSSLPAGPTNGAPALSLMSAVGDPAPNTVWLACRYRSQPLQHWAAAVRSARLFVSGTKSAALWAAMSGGYPGSRGHSPRRLPGGLGDLGEAELPSLDDVKAELLRDPVGGALPKLGPGPSAGPLSRSPKVLSRSDTVHNTVHWRTRSATPQIPRCACHSRFRVAARAPRPGSMSFSWAAARAAVNGRIGPGFQVAVLSMIRQSPGAARLVMTSATWL